MKKKIGRKKWIQRFGSDKFTEKELNTEPTELEVNVPFDVNHIFGKIKRGKQNLNYWIHSTSVYPTIQKIKYNRIQKWFNKK